jgi:glycosyltransferase involved in cell wall biosynthesis
MKIVLVVNSMGSGGAERVASTLANAWAERGDVVTMLATYSRGGECFYRLHKNVRLIYLAPASRIGRSKLAGYVLRLRALRKSIRHIDPDVVVSFLTNVNVTTIVASAGLRIPVIACEHTNPLSDGRSAFWRLLVRVVYPHANTVTLLTESVVQPFRHSAPAVTRITVMPNPLPDELLAMGVVPQVAKRERRVVSVARLQALKQFDHLITAFGILASEFPEWSLWIWGDGPMREQLEAQIRDNGLTGRVFLPGRTTEPWKKMTEADVFVLCSRFEGMPMAMMESMALGLPVVAYDCPSGPRELTRNGQDGVLVPPGDTTGLADGLRLVMKDDVLRQELGRKGADSVRERFSISNLLSQWDELFGNVGAISVSK